MLPKKSMRAIVLRGKHRKSGSKLLFLRGLARKHLFRLMNMVYEIHKYINILNPRVVATDIPSIDEAMLRLNNFIKNNPEYQYRLVEIIIDYVQRKPLSSKDMVYKHRVNHLHNEE